MLLSGTPDFTKSLGGPRISAITYATPPVVTEDLANQFATCITCVVNQYDMVGPVGGSLPPATIGGSNWKLVSMTVLRGPFACV